MEVIAVVISLVNCLVFVVYGMDKYFAIHRKHRISEKRLIQFTFLGPFGALFGIYIWRHKTKKWYFPALAGSISIVHLILVLYLFQDQILMVF